MSILSFQKPDRVVELERKDEFTGIYEFRPLEPGYALTVGNAMRRVLLSSLEGYAILSVRFDGVSHEFSSIDGVVEDVTEIILNLKQLRFRPKQEAAIREEVSFQFSGKKQILGSDLESKLSQFEVLTKDTVICNLDPSVSLTFHLIIDKGRGYVSAEENKALIEEAPLGTIHIDSVHTPIKNVSYSIENYRVEQRTDYEKLIFEVKTDGSILPKVAVTEAAKILIQHLILISDEDKIAKEAEAISNQKTYDEDSLRMRQLLKMKVEDLEVSARSLNCLSQNGIYTLGDLVALKETDLMKFRNFGRISLVELKELLVHNGLSFGMDKDNLV